MMLHMNTCLNNQSYWWGDLYPSFFGTIPIGCLINIPVTWWNSHIISVYFCVCVGLAATIEIQINELIWNYMHVISLVFRLRKILQNVLSTVMKELMQHMNSQNPSMQFTPEYSREEITFLDVTKYKDRKRSDKLQLRTFIKPTNRQSTNSSHHPLVQPEVWHSVRP